MNEQPFQFGIVQAIRQPAIRPVNTTWERFCKALESPKIRDQKDGPGAVFATFDKQWRNRENVQSVTSLAYDLEAQPGGPAIPAPAAIAEDLRGLGLAFAVWTTFSDKPEARRIRVVLPIEGGIDPDLLRAAYLLPLKYVPIIDPAILDQACAEPARMMILPAAPAERAAAYECYHNAGDWLLGASLALTATKCSGRRRMQQRPSKGLSGPVHLAVGNLSSRRLTGSIQSKRFSKAAAINGAGKSGSLQTLTVGRPVSSSRTARLSATMPTHSAITFGMTPSTYSSSSNTAATSALRLRPCVGGSNKWLT